MSAHSYSRARRLAQTEDLCALLQAAYMVADDEMRALLEGSEGCKVARLRLRDFLADLRERDEAEAKRLLTARLSFESAKLTTGEFNEP